jgi:hypothetical protein
LTSGGIKLQSGDYAKIELGNYSSDSESSYLNKSKLQFYGIGSHNYSNKLYLTCDGLFTTCAGDISCNLTNNADVPGLYVYLGDLITHWKLQIHGAQGSYLGINFYTGRFIDNNYA